MSDRPRKYVLDTQLFIHAFHDIRANEALQEFHRLFAPFEYFSAVVAQELRTGIRNSRDGRALDRHVLRVFERANRLITPSAAVWHQSGDLLSKMAQRDGLEVSRISKAFSNDVLLALSCREAGCVLITENRRDFARIRRFTRFEFIEPWPALVS